MSKTVGQTTVNSQSHKRQSSKNGAVVATSEEPAVTLVVAMATAITKSEWAITFSKTAIDLNGIIVSTGIDVHKQCPHYQRQLLWRIPDQNSPAT